MQARIDIEAQDERWVSAVPEHKVFFSRRVAACLKRFPDHPLFEQKKEIEVSLLLCDDIYMQQINLDYRNQDKPTNVLSFATAHDHNEAIIDHEDAELMLGDMVFSLDTIRREATEQGKSFEDHLTHIIIHGTLHLLGFDHIEDEDAEVMEATEIEILKEFNINNPYHPLEQ